MQALNKQKIVGFELWGDYAHYSHPATNYSSLTYPIPPKTTVMGLLGAIIGLDNYECLNDIKYSVVLKNNLTKKEYQFNGIMKALSNSLKLKEGYQDSSMKKQFKRELVVSPKYEIYLDLSSIENDIADKIVKYIDEHKSVYQIYMGSNAFGANFEKIEINTIEKVEDEYIQVNSFALLNDFIFDINEFNRVSNMRFATKIDVEKRKFSGFKDFIVEISGKQKIKIKNNGSVYMINDKGICFV